eukprot:Lankesteria_metandrocarpae@DN8875_c0_g1_i1.p1
MKDSDRGRVHRLWLYLQRYDLCITHWSGEFNVLADWLSRDLSLTVEESDEIDEMSLALAVYKPGNRFAEECRLPQVTELIDAYPDCPEDELRDTYLATDGLRYSVRFNKLYIPPMYRAAIV